MIVVVHHAGCFDGFGAAWAHWRATGGKHTTYLPAGYGTTIRLAEGSVAGLDNRELVLGRECDVYVLDLSFDRGVLDELAQRLQHLEVLDHHRTAAANLSGAPYATIDLTRSGAHIAWNRFHPGAPVPRLIEYVEDRDLWLHALPDSRAVTAWLGSWPMTFPVWNDIARQVEDELPQVVREGNAILRSHRQLVERMGRHYWWADIAGYRVPVSNATALVSEVAELLLEQHPEASFAAYYAEHTAGRHWGLRSRRDGVDVSAVARSLGGGGHTQAAGFWEETPGSVVRRCEGPEVE